MVVVIVVTVDDIFLCSHIINTSGSCPSTRDRNPGYQPKGFAGKAIVVVVVDVVVFVAVVVVIVINPKVLQASPFLS